MSAGGVKWKMPDQGAPFLLGNDSSNYFFLAHALRVIEHDRSFEKVVFNGEMVKAVEYRIQESEKHHLGNQLTFLTVEVSIVVLVFVVCFAARNVR
jgi:hypothetical protein